MSEEPKTDWLMEMSPNPHLTAGMPYSPPPEEAESQTSITYKERSIPSSGDALWLEDDAQTNKQKRMESLFLYGYNPPLPILYVD